MGPRQQRARVLDVPVETHAVRHAERSRLRLQRRALLAVAEDVERRPGTPASASMARSTPLRGSRRPTSTNVNALRLRGVAGRREVRRVDAVRHARVIRSAAHGARASATARTCSLTATAASARASDQREKGQQLGSS